MWKYLGIINGNWVAINLYSIFVEISVGISFKWEDSQAKSSKILGINMYIPFW